MERVGGGEATEMGGGARGQQGRSGKPRAVKKPQGRLAVPCTPAPLGPPATQPLAVEGQQERPVSGSQSPVSCH